MATPPATGARPAAKKTAAAKPAGHTTSGATASAEPTQKSLEQHLASIAEGEVMDPQGLYEFLESLRAVTTGLAFFTHAAATQIESAARKGARNSNDGRLTLAQKAKLALVLRRMGRRMNNDISEDLLAAATGAVKTYALLEEFLEEIESSTVSRPHRNTRGGFNLGGR